MRHSATTEFASSIIGTVAPAGKRYIFYTVPLTRAGGGYDARYMTVNYAMPIDAEGRVEDIAADGTRVRIALAEAIERIVRGAAASRWPRVR